MARFIFSLALLACLGFAVLQLVSGEQQNQDIEAVSSEAIEASPEEVQVRLLRDADAKKRTNKKGKKGKKDRKVKRRQQRKKNKKNRKVKRGKKGTKKGKNKKGRKLKKNRRKQKVSKKGKKKSGRKSKKSRREQKKKRKQRKLRKQRKQEKARRKSRKNHQKHHSFKSKQSTNTTNSSCNVEDLCQKIKNYIKYSNQLRKLKRINKTCTTMEKKRDKAGGGEFNASAEANSDSGNDTVNAIADELKNCTATAKANCETKAIAACTNLTLNTKCEKELSDWIKKFGPEKGSCLQKSKDCCKCINDISPDPSKECLEFDALDNSSKEKKKKCTASGTKGSFGYCRKLQMQAAEKGPGAHKAKCKKGMAGTTQGAGRRMLFRNNLLKKWSNL